IEMTDEVTVLTCATIERLPKSTFIYQVDDGTIFYREWKTPARLYVKWQGIEIEARLPSRKIAFEGVHNDAIFFVTDQDQICEAVFTPKEGIVVYYQRDRHQDEQIHSRGLCSTVVDGEKYVYRMGDLAGCSNVHVDIPDQQLKTAQLIGIHRGVAIYAKSKKGLDKPEVSAWSANVCVISVPDLLMSYLNVLQFKLYAHDYSPFLYFTVDGQILYTFDTETMELLPPLQFENVKIESILSVREDVILLKGRNDTADFYLLTAQLPKRYAYIHILCVRKHLHRCLRDWQRKREMKEGKANPMPSCTILLTHSRLNF
ncbi:hypothetical protein PRIPAC_91335, partial [Pristionchus pacificus]